jgi:hypothetical protein
VKKSVTHPGKKGKRPDFSGQQEKVSSDLPKLLKKGQISGETTVHSLDIFCEGV